MTIYLHWVRRRVPPGYAFMTDGNGISLYRMRALLGLFNLREDPFTYICIRPVAIAREFLENSTHVQRLLCR